jgi:hypothetical protein
MVLLNHLSARKPQLTETPVGEVDLIKCFLRFSIASSQIAQICEDQLH